MAGPGVTSQQGQLQTFAIGPYGLPPDLLTVRKPILDKAMAILASMRMGEHFGGLTSLHDPAAMLHALLQPGRWVAKHSSTPRQYGVLKDMGIIRFGTFGFLTGMQLIDTHDNKEAVGVAIDLLTFGEAMAMKEVPVVGTAGQSPQNYRSPIQTVRPARKRKPLPKKTVADSWETAMAFKPSVWARSRRGSPNSSCPRAMIDCSIATDVRSRSFSAISEDSPLSRRRRSRKR